jgi:hypothetical protein
MWGSDEKGNSPGITQNSSALNSEDLYFLNMLGI